MALKSVGFNQSVSRVILCSLSYQRSDKIIITHCFNNIKRFEYQLAPILQYTRQAGETVSPDQTTGREINYEQANQSNQ